MGAVETYLNIQKSSEQQLDAEQYALFVKRIAERFKSHLPPSLGLEDLMQEGMLALLEIYDQYDSNVGVTFEAFASLRLRGAMIDLLRKTMPFSKEKLALIRKADQFIDDYQKKHHIKPGEIKIAENLNITLEKYRALRIDSMGNLSEAFDECSFADLTILAPEHYLDIDITRQTLIASLKVLSDREQTIISLYYLEELTFVEIGKVLGLSESRVSQLHKLATNKLRQMLKTLSD